MGDHTALRQVVSVAGVRRSWFHKEGWVQKLKKGEPEMLRDPSVRDDVRRKCDPVMRLTCRPAKEMVRDESHIIEPINRC